MLTVESQCKKCLDDSDVAQCFECGCAICGGKENQEVLLFCELCQFYNHTYCLNPPLENIPEHDFLCPKCGTQCQVCEKFFPDLLNKHLMRKTNRCKNLKEDYRKMVEAAQKTALETKKSLENKNNKGMHVLRYFLKNAHLYYMLKNISHMHQILCSWVSKMTGKHLLFKPI